MDHIELTEREAYAIADTFALASCRILECRLEHDQTLTDQQADDLEQCEDRLDHLVVLFRGYGIRLIGAGAQEAANELRAAVEAGKDVLKNIANVQKALIVSTALVGLATAVLGREPKAVLSAAKQVKASAQSNA